MSTKDQSKFDFGQSLKELEAIASWFEGENVDLDEGLVKFERGMALANQLKDHLGQIENRIEEIKVKYETTPTPEEPSAAPPQPPADQLF